MSTKPPGYLDAFFHLLQSDIVDAVQYGGEPKTPRELDEEAVARCTWWLDQPRDWAPPRTHRPEIGDRRRK